MACLRMLIFAATALLAGCAVHYGESRFIGPRPGAALDVDQARAALPPGYAVETGFVEAGDGDRQFRVAFTHPQAKADVLFFPGAVFRTGEEAVLYAEALIGAWRPNVVFYDYRGRGLSTGRPDVAALRSDALLAYDTERRRVAAQGRKLVLCGFSLGGVVAGGVAEQRAPDGLILIATATNAAEFVDEMMPWFAKPFVTVDIAPPIASIDNRRALAAYTGPLLVVAAGRDQVMPAVFSQRLFAAAATREPHKRLVVAPEADHMAVLKSRELSDALRQFAADNGL